VLIGEVRTRYQLIRGSLVHGQLVRPFILTSRINRALGSVQLVASDLMKLDRMLAPSHLWLDLLLRIRVVVVRLLRGAMAARLAGLSENTALFFGLLIIEVLVVVVTIESLLEHLLV